MRKKSNFLYIAAVVFIIVFSLGPILWSFVISVTPENEMLKASTSILPQEPMLDNYKSIFDTSTKEHQVAFKGLKNSLLMSGLTLIIGVPTSLITAYALARYDFKGKKMFVNLLLLTIVIPAFATLIPVYSIFRKLGLLDNVFWTSVIYLSSFLPLNTWIIMNYIKEIPKELWQAAAIDGFNERQIFFKIAVPICCPIILTSVLIMFIMSWKQYIIPMILISSHKHKMLTMVMSEFMTRDAIKYGIIAAVGIVSIIPPAIVAMIFRKFLVSGLTAGTVKQ
ncbi:MAG: carbohydrate ABC transporter permease [Tissierellia bacterium]|nr:carbohydrate ABC transporter permease [Tissierellia bacterium]